MAEAKNYLDKEGLKYLVGKIKTELGKKVTLGDDGMVPASVLPSYVDDVQEFTGFVDNVNVEQSMTSNWYLIGFVYDTTTKLFLGAYREGASTGIGVSMPKYSLILLPGDLSKNEIADLNVPNGNKPEAGKIYVNVNTNKTYRWSGSDLVEISSSLALGETSESAYAGDKGKKNSEDIAANTKDIAAIKSGDLPLVSPQIVPVSGQSSIWQVQTADGKVVNGSWGNGNLNTIYGYSVFFSGCMKWTHTDGYKDPTAMNGGDWANTALPLSGVLSDKVSEDDILADNTITASIKAPKQGLVLSNGIIKQASSSDFDTKSASVRVHFQYKVIKITSNNEVGTTDLEKALEASERGNSHKLQDNKNVVLTGVTTQSDEYLVYAYPSKLGELSKITMNDATPLLKDGFKLSKLTITDNETGKSLEYNVYTSVQRGAFTGAKLDIA